MFAKFIHTATVSMNLASMFERTRGLRLQTARFVNTFERTRELSATWTFKPKQVAAALMKLAEAWAVAA